jgi:3-mercaptopyruvate sulfurtransferase SseA
MRFFIAATMIISCSTGSLAGLGIDEKTPVVVYGDGARAEAARDMMSG